MNNCTKQVIEKFFDVEEIDMSKLTDSQKLIVSNLNKLYNFQCPECGSENILLGYGDHCITWLNQKKNTFVSCDPVLWFDNCDLQLGKCLDCNCEWEDF